MVLTLPSASRGARGIGKTLCYSESVHCPTYQLCKLRQLGVHRWHSAILMVPSRGRLSRSEFLILF